MNKETLESMMLELETAISNNRRQHQELQAKHGWCRNWLLSPSYQLPDEALASIFDFCVSFDQEALTSGEDASLWSITHTCRKWRAVAVSQPALWRYIHVNIGDAPGYPPEDHYFSRVIMELLLNESHRCHEAHLDLNCDHELYCWLAEQGRLGVDLLGDWCALDGSGFSDAPKLSTAILLIEPEYTNNSDDGPSHIPMITLPWHQLCQYGCHYFGDTEFFDIMAQLHTVEDLKLTDPSHYDVTSSFSSTRFLTFPVLHCFEFHPPDVETASSFLDHLTVPALNDLQIRLYTVTDYEESEMLLTSIVTLCTRSPCQLQNLDLEIEVFSCPSSPQLTSSLTTVRTLTLRFSRWEQTQRQRHGLDNLRSGPPFRL
ncbi:hypothetical protein L218DRAFT_1077809 [Marasmius fiardii PR-910]|nr:hypothetical protein L218DRAFT_1077809 [Marasmius fiardii PR-910]